MACLWSSVKRLYTARDIEEDVFYLIGSSHSSLRADKSKAASEAVSQAMGKNIEIVRPVPRMRCVTFLAGNLTRVSDLRLSITTEEMIWLYDSMSEVVESWWNVNKGGWSFYDVVYTPGISVKTQKELGALYQSDFFTNFKVEGHDETIVMIGVLEYFKKIPMKEE